MTPAFIAAQCFPEAASLFSQLSIRNAEDVVFHCARDGCTNRATKVCKKCRRAWYCSRECQVAAHPTHKAACTAIHGELTRFFTAVPKFDLIILVVEAQKKIFLIFLHFIFLIF